MESLLIGIVFVSGAVGLSVLGLFLVRRSVRLETLEDHHEVAGFFIGVLGVLYAVLLAFVVLAVWEDYNDASAVASAEASQLADLHWLAEGFSADQREDLQSAVRTYASVVIDDEWPKMDRGEHSPSADGAFSSLQALYTALEPDEGREASIYDASLERMATLSDSRSDRLHINRDGLSPILWVVLVVGGAITILFTYFFGVRNLRAQALMTALLAAMMALALFVILSFDHPYRGDLSVGPDAFEDALVEFSE